MKLSKKVGIMFIVMTLLTIISYFVSSKIMINYLYQGETTRITGITGGAANRLEGEAGKLFGKANEYARYVQFEKKLSTQYGLDGAKIIELEEQFKNDGIKYKIFLDKNKDIQEVYSDEAQGIINKEDIQKIGEAAKSILMAQKAPVFRGGISNLQEPYLMAITPIRNQQEIEGYFVVAQPINQSLIIQIGKGMGRNLELVHELDLDKVTTTVLSEKEEQKGKEFYLIYSNDSLESYFEIESQYGEGRFFVRLTEPLVVKQSTQRNMYAFTVILSILIVGLNTIFGMLIRRLLIKRIVNMNHSINQISESSNFRERLKDDQVGDEISTLGRDINKMLGALEEANTNIRCNEQKYKSVLKTMTNGFAYYRLDYDEEGNFLNGSCEEFNDAFTYLLDLENEEIINSKINIIFKHNKMEIDYIEEILARIKIEGKPYIIEQLQIRPGVWVAVNLYSVGDDYLTVILTNITGLKDYSDQMKILSQKDFLTGIKNRYSLYEYIDKLKNNNTPFVIYLMDLDNFKMVNDTLGHREGDKILTLVAQELSTLEQIDNESITISRLGGDEFVVVRVGQFDKQVVEQFGQQLLNLLGKKFEYTHYNYEIRTSIGVSMYPEQALDIETLLKYCDIAMYKSKNKGGNNVQIFSNEMLEEIKMEISLKEAINNQEFVAYYQPVLNVEQNRIVGAEALVRWIKNGEIIAPAKFIHIAKKTGIIAEIDFTVLDLACCFCKKWRMNGYDDFDISVNMSYRALKSPQCIQRIKESLEKHQLEASALKIEITEDEVLDYPQYIIKTLKEIKKLGVKVSLDDFGVGYSSFNHIKMLPIDTLKIDRSLLLELGEDEKTVSILEMLIKMAHTLELDIICEGVEVASQLELLKNLQCDKIQGYLISQPVEEKIFYSCMMRYNGFEEEDQTI